MRCFTCLAIRANSCSALYAFQRSARAGKDRSQALLADEDKQREMPVSLRHRPPPAWPGFRPLRVAAVQQECVDVRSFVLESEDRSPLPAPLPGQFLVFKLELEATRSRPAQLFNVRSAGYRHLSHQREARRRRREADFFHDRIQRRRHASGERAQGQLHAGCGR